MDGIHLFSVETLQGSNNPTCHLRPVLCHCLGQCSSSTRSNICGFVLYTGCWSMLIHIEVRTHRGKALRLPRTAQGYPCHSLPIYGGPTSRLVHRHHGTQSTFPETNQGLSGRRATVMLAWRARSGAQRLTWRACKHALRTYTSC